MATGSAAGKGDVLLLVGTKKGCFILSSNKSRRTWALAGPYCAGDEVFHFVYDPRDAVCSWIDSMMADSFISSADSVTSRGLLKS